MPRPASPLLQDHERHGARFLGYGPAGAAVAIVERYDSVEFEYASLRKGCVLFDEPHRGTIEIRGTDRLAFLNNLVTQELVGLGRLEHRSSFWLNRKGRIEADLRVCDLGDRFIVDVDTHAAPGVCEGLRGYVFAEDVQIEDVSERYCRLGLHGPTASTLLELAGPVVAGPGPAEVGAGRAFETEIAGRRVVAERTDWCGEPGFELTTARDDVAEVWSSLREIGQTPRLDTETGMAEREPSAEQARVRMRCAGWLAVNVARIEAGTPLFNVDFGSTNLPAETGLLHDRVSFKKGCYLGQEVVARMDALGKPKQALVALRLGADAPDPSAVVQPEAGAPLAVAEGEPPVGAVTSSSISPMLGGAPVCFAMVRESHTAPGTRLAVETLEGAVEAVVQERLRFWSRGG